MEQLKQLCQQTTMQTHAIISRNSKAHGIWYRIFYQLKRNAKFKKQFAQSQTLQGPVYIPTNFGNNSNEPGNSFHFISVLPGEPFLIQKMFLKFLKFCFSFLTSIINLSLLKVMIKFTIQIGLPLNLPKLMKLSIISLEVCMLPVSQL